MLPLALAAGLGFFAASPTTYTDERKKAVSFPLGDVSFADEVVSFERGKPRGPDVVAKPEAVLGAPDYDKKNSDANYLTLGCGGALVLRFADNMLVDVEGPDLFVFEIGPQVEPTILAISNDGKEWIDVGRISGGTAFVDIAAQAKTTPVFHYVRLTDAKIGCGSRYPGADIDAVGAIGSGLALSLRASVLFEVNKAELRPEAKAELEAAAKKIAAHPKARVIIEGHTDAQGSTAHNAQLSKARAASVKKELEALGVPANELEAQGRGEGRPIASNDTEEGREKNRRVEILVIPR